MENTNTSPKTESVLNQRELDKEEMRREILAEMKREKVTQRIKSAAMSGFYIGITCGIVVAFINVASALTGGGRKE